MRLCARCKPPTDMMRKEWSKWGLVGQVVLAACGRAPVAPTPCSCPSPGDASCGTLVAIDSSVVSVPEAATSEPSIPNDPLVEAPTQAVGDVLTIDPADRKHFVEGLDFVDPDSVEFRDGYETVTLTKD